MKKVEEIFGPSKLDNVKEDFTAMGITGLTITEVKGLGRRHATVISAVPIPYAYTDTLAPAPRILNAGRTTYRERM